MAEATIEEKQNLAELNQAHLEEGGNEEKTNKTKSSSEINFVEMGLVLGAALAVDLIDALDLTGVGAVLVRFIDIPTMGALWLWRVIKHQTGPKKNLTFQILMTFLVELSPFGMLPTWTIFVLYCYFKDTKLGKETIGRAEKLTKAK